MNNNNFLIPANSKKSQLILGFFTGFDLAVFLGGVVFSIILLCLIKSDNLMVMLGLASPAILAAFLVAPVPNYHNVMTLIGNIYRYSTGRKKYYWRGWCVRNGNNRSN
jgi:hypothetical protein